MSHFDIFNNDAFTLMGLTQSIQDAAYKPGRIGQMGLFEERPITTTSVSVEKRGDTIGLVESQPRGSSGKVYQSEKRTLRNLSTVHLPQRASVLADEILGMRKFGTEDEIQNMASWLQAEYLGPMKRDIEVTQEWLRMGAIKGQVVDGDGSTVLLDLFTEFGVSQNTDSWTIASDDIRANIVALKRNIATKLQGLAWSGVHIFCSSTFFDGLIGNSTVEAAYDRFQDGAFLRDDYSQFGLNGFTFGSTRVTFEEYWGNAGSEQLIADGKAYAVPTGVSGLFQTRFAPADYVETVNTPGFPYYAKQQALDMDKGIELEAQSNPLHYCSRPDAVVELTAV